MRKRSKHSKFNSVTPEDLSNLAWNAKYMFNVDAISTVDSYIRTLMILFLHLIRSHP